MVGHQGFFVAFEIIKVWVFNLIMANDWVIPFNFSNLFSHGYFPFHNNKWNPWQSVLFAYLSLVQKWVRALITMRMSRLSQKGIISIQKHELTDLSTLYDKIIWWIITFPWLLFCFSSRHLCKKLFPKVVSFNSKIIMIVTGNNKL